MGIISKSTMNNNTIGQNIPANKLRMNLSIGWSFSYRFDIVYIVTYSDMNEYMIIVFKIHLLFIKYTIIIPLNLFYF